jgi:hypothetical protein
MLLNEGPLVMIFDEIDNSIPGQVSIIETFLQDLVDDTKIFVVLASQNEISFQPRQKVAKNLKTISLEPFGRAFCDQFFLQSHPTLSSSDLLLLYEWTQGYPLAVRVAADTVKQGHYPSQPLDATAILQHLNQEVINNVILAKVADNQKEKYNGFLRSLAVPRLINLNALQHLIEKFHPEHNKKTPMGYFGLPREIHEITGVLKFYDTQAAFTINEPVRALLLRLFKDEQPERFREVNAFFAEFYGEQARKSAGDARSLLVRESLYHLAFILQESTQMQQINVVLQIMLAEKPATIRSFAHDLTQDRDLQQVLGQQLSLIQSTLNRHLNEMPEAQ